MLWRSNPAADIDYQTKLEHDGLPFGQTEMSQMQAMLQQSDNEAWESFNAALSGEGLESYARSIGLSSFTVSDNTLTAADEGALLARLYGGRLMNAAHTAFVLSAMQNTNNDSLIPAALPAGAVAYHKYGELEGELHDAAIVHYRSRTFVVVVYTNNEREQLDDSDSRAELIHRITSIVVNAEGKVVSA